jgi:hypothetical protein
MKNQDFENNLRSALLREAVRREEEIQHLMALLKLRYDFQHQINRGRTRREDVHNYLSLMTGTAISNQFVGKIHRALSRLGVQRIKAFGRNYYKHMQVKGLPQGLLSAAQLIPDPQE